MHLGDRARARRPASAAAQPDHGDMTTANAESGQIRPANKPGRGRLQHMAFFVAMGAQPIGLLEVDAKLRWRGVCWLSLSHRPGPAWREEQCADMGQFEGLTAP